MSLDTKDFNQTTDLRKGSGVGGSTKQAGLPKENADTPNGESREPTMLQVLWETIRYAIIAALIIIPIRTFVAQPFVVSGNSMFPTFANGQYLIVDETAKYIGDYERGDVVILRYPNDPSKYFIKRVIGLPGETVSISNGAVSITSATQKTPLLLSEPYVKNAKFDTSVRALASDEYFVMGDNRAQSSDSRVWGPVPKKLMDGKALLRLFPLADISMRPGGVESFGITY